MSTDACCAHEHAHAHSPRDADGVVERKPSSLTPLGVCRDAYELGGLCCRMMASALTDDLAHQQGVLAIDADATSQRLAISHDASLVSCESIRQLLDVKHMRPHARLLAEDHLALRDSSVAESVLAVSDLCCASEARIIVSALSARAGVASVRPNAVLKRVAVTHDAAQVSCADMVAELASVGLTAAVERDGAAALLPAARLAESTLRVQGMCCASEATVVSGLLLPLPGVATVSANPVLKSATIVHDPAQTSAGAMAALLTEQGLATEVAKDGAREAPQRTDSRGDGEDEEAREEARNLAGSRLPPWRVSAALVCWLVSLLHYVQDPAWMVQLRFVALGSVVLCLPPIGFRALQRLARLTLDINVLMSLAVVGALALGDFSEAAAVVSLFSVSDWLEARATRRVRAAVAAMLRLAPASAELAQACALADGREAAAGERVAVELVPVGALLTVRGGDKFPLDGSLTDHFGDTYFADESALTGEAAPVKKRAGDSVAAGTVNAGALAQMRATATHSESAVAKMVKLVEQATAARAPTQQLVERVANVYTPVVFVSAILMATLPWAWGNDVGREWARTALVLLVVGCPCALVISTPITYVCGLAQAARMGVLVKGGKHLEALGKLRTLCVDKTGTITQGRFAAAALDFAPLRRRSPDLASLWTERELLQMLLEAEQGSSHPMATALREAARAQLLQLPADGPEAPAARLAELTVLAGEGVRATLVAAPREAHETAADLLAAPELLRCLGDHGCDGRAREVNMFVGSARLATRLGWAVDPADAARVGEWERQGLTTGWIGVDDTPVALFRAGDSPRPEAAEVVQELRKQLGVKVVMLTGDNAGAAAAVCAQVGIEEFHAALLPEDKVAQVRAQAGVVGMLGDGVNDAPSLAAAHVSVSLGGIGSAAALEAADVALMQDDLRKLPAALRLGRQCNSKIAQNIALSVGTKVAVLIVTLAAFQSLWLAIAVDVGAMLAVTLNSMTVLRPKQKTAATEPVGDNIV